MIMQNGYINNFSSEAYIYHSVSQIQRKHRFRLFSLQKGSLKNGILQQLQEG